MPEVSDHSINNENRPSVLFSPPKRSRRWWVFALVVLGVMMLSLGTAFGILRYHLREETIKELVQNALKESLGLTAQISAIDIHLLHGEIIVRQLDLIAPEQTTPLFTAKNVSVDLELLRSLLTLKLSAKITIDDWALHILRERRRNSRGENATITKIDDGASDDHTTNIHDTLRQFTTLPWAQWIENFATLQHIDAQIISQHGAINLYDQAKRLDDCRLDFSAINVKKSGNDFTVQIAGNLQTPNTPAEKAGTLAINAHWQIALTANNVLEQVREIHTAIDFINCDVAYITRYYGVGWRLSRRNYLTLGAPINGKITINAATLNEEITVNYQLETPEILALRAENNPPITFPMLLLNGAMQGFLTGEWKINDTTLSIGEATNKWINLLVSGSGKIGTGLTLTVNLAKNLGLFAQSQLAETLGLAKKFVGDVSLRSFIKIGRGDKSTISVDIIANNFGVEVDGQMQDFPLNGRAAAKFIEDGKGNAENIEIDLKLASPIVNFSTPEGALQLPRIDEWRKFRGQFFIEANTAEFCRRFHSTLTKLDLGNLNEKITGTVTFVENSAQAKLTLTNLSAQPDPLSLAVTVATSEHPTFSGELKSLDNAVFVKVSGKVAPDKSVEFTQQGAMRMEKAAGLYQRFATLFHGQPLPQMQGILRNSFAGRITPAPMTLTAKINALLENATLQDGDFVWQEPKAQIQSDLIYHAPLATITLPAFALRSSSINLDFNAGALPLSAINNATLAQLFTALPAFNLGLVVGESAWRQINYLTNNILPEALFSLRSQATLLASFAPATQRLHIQKLEINAGKNANAALRELFLTTTITNPATIISSPNLPTILQNLPQGLQIARAIINVTDLQKYPPLADMIGALPVQEIGLGNIQLTAQKATAFTLSGALSGTFRHYGEDKQKPLCALSGTAEFLATQPLQLHINDHDLTAKGMLDLTNCAVQANFSPTYFYQKETKQPLRLSFDVAQRGNGEIEIAQAQLDGGAMPFSVQKLLLSIKDSAKLKVSVASAKIDAPLPITIDNVLLDQEQNILRGNFRVGEIDVAQIRPFLTLPADLQIAGKLNGITANLDAPYQFLENFDVSNLGNTQITLGGLNAQATNVKNQAQIHTAFAGVQFNGKNGEVIISDWVIANPVGFTASTPALSVKTLYLKPQWATLNKTTMIIDELTLDKLFVLCERLANKNVNLTALEKAVANLSPTSATTNNNNATKLPMENSPTEAVNHAPSMIVKTLRTTNSIVRLQMPPINNKEIDLNFTLTDVSSASSSAIIAQIIQTVMGSVMKSMAIEMLKNPETIKLLADNLLPKDLLPAGIMDKIGALKNNSGAGNAGGLGGLGSLVDKVTGGNNSAANATTDKTGVVKNLFNSLGLSGKKADEVPAADATKTNDANKTATEPAPATEADKNKDAANRLGKQLFNMFK